MYLRQSELADQWRDFDLVLQYSLQVAFYDLFRLFFLRLYQNLLAFFTVSVQECLVPLHFEVESTAWDKLYPSSNCDLHVLESHQHYFLSFIDLELCQLFGPSRVFVSPQDVKHNCGVRGAEASGKHFHKGRQAINNLFP